MFSFLNHGRRNTGGSETLAAWSCPYQRYATDLLLVGQLLQLAMLSYSQSKCPAWHTVTISCRDWSISTSTGFSTETWNRTTCWLTARAVSNSGILVWPSFLDRPPGNTPTWSWRGGTGHQNSCLAPSSTEQVSRKLTKMHISVLPYGSYFLLIRQRNRFFILKSFSMICMFFVTLTYFCPNLYPMKKIPGCLSQSGH